MTTREERIQAKMAQIRAQQEEKAIEKEARYRLLQERESKIKQKAYWLHLREEAENNRKSELLRIEQKRIQEQKWSWCNDGSVDYWVYKGMPYYRDFDNGVWDSSHVWVGKYDPELDKLDMTASEPVYDEEENC